MASRLLIIIGALIAALMLPRSADAAAMRTTNALNLRYGPGVGYAVITVIPARARVEVIGRSRGWCHIEYRRYRGWSSCRYLVGVAPSPRYAHPVPGVDIYPVFPTPWIFDHDRDARPRHKPGRPKHGDHDRKRRKPYYKDRDGDGERRDRDSEDHDDDWKRRDRHDEDYDRDWKSRDRKWWPRR